MKLNKMDPVDLLNAANIQDQLLQNQIFRGQGISIDTARKRAFLELLRLPPSPPLTSTPTIVCKITLLCSTVSSLVFSQHIAFKLGNFSDFKVFFSVVLKGFCYLIPVKSGENKRPWKGLLIKALVFHAGIK